MTLKKCTLRQLDDTFWRVDWEGPAAEARTANCTLTANSPSIAERDGESWFFCGIWSQSLEEALARFDLTTEDPSPETAEEVLRANAKIHPGYGDEHVVSGFTRDHAREILDVLDAARADRDTHKTAADVYLERLRRAHKEIDRLGESLCEQQAVSVEAVLAPVREACDRLGRRCVSAASESDKYRGVGATAFDLARAAVEDGERGAYAHGHALVRNAIAEAEKIGRGQ